MALSVTSKPLQPSNTGEIQESDGFQKFDVVSDSSDHRFNSYNTSKKTTGGDCFTNVSSKAHRRIMQEWKMLEKDLPDSIFVRAYENRIDLLRAVIIGAAGTPYHDGLYFFDIAFPSDYPSRPPDVHYRSYGLRINPNLYANGRVCLSLINTWPGKKNEKWNPKESTVLQILVSIQALVLNEKPYFNEPGHGMWPGRAIWEKRSNSYNEDVFVLSCKTMLFLLRRPPKNFEGLVIEHFRERAHAILSACNAYTSGRVRVGFYTSGGGSTSSSSSSTVEVSDKFEGSISQLYPQLVAGFTRSGASLGTLTEQLVERKTVSYKKNQVVVKKNTKSNSGVARRVLGKLKKVLGLSKKSGKSSVKKTTMSS
ncbi:hypothetical protein JCGZ_19017 [Jatropha curcas]|uniref:UBC core domain-containing protein n=1 Tax=Jatropha curcas TaxID=180498 RepID=A0A067JVM3_JATCU|nr:putative ubiquitin-conjugating enzyme E2 38 [Jatropha curcas]KDP27937.1 hypothetical protein JCGZ_19017 [Jatropha curcas]